MLFYYSHGKGKVLYSNMDEKQCKFSRKRLHKNIEGMVIYNTNSCEM